MKCALTVAGIAVVVLLIWGSSSATSYEQFVCDSCGMLRTLYIKKKAGIAYWRKDTASQTETSRRLFSDGTPSCPHHWVLMKFGQSYHGWFFGAGYDADGGFATSALLTVLNDVRFAEGWETMAQPREVLHQIVAAFESRPEDAAAVLEEEWWSSQGSLSLRACLKNGDSASGTLPRSSKAKKCDMT
ncbi:MAG: hypothetical protein H7A46_22925 [Verrucomicrobiales bacterium]|nr:hypothetical protein [Verrucomicrobiales bacterium]